MNTSQNSTLKELIIESIDNQKGLDILEIDLKNKTDLADFLVIVSGTSARHVYTLASKTVEFLKQNGYKGVTMEGEESGNWIIVDATDVILHVFLPEVRTYYKLEKLWLEEIKKPSLIEL